MVAKILPFFSPHWIYVEPFGGGASLLFAKQPSRVEVYNDIDADLVNFFSVISDPASFGKFYRRVILLPYSRSLYLYCLNEWKPENDPIKKAVKYFIVRRQGFSGIMGTGWSYGRLSRRKMGQTVHAWLSILEILPLICSRLSRVLIECSDFRRIFKNWDSPETFFYCDPPYIASTRRGGNFKNEMTDDDHREMVEILLGLKGRALLSCYDHSIYQPLSCAGWEKRKFNVACSAAGRTRRTGILGAGATFRKKHGG